QHGSIDLLEERGLIDDFLKKVLRTQDIRFTGENGHKVKISRHDCSACGRRNAPAPINEDDVIFASEWFDFLMEIACWQANCLNLGLIRWTVSTPIQRGSLRVGIDHQHLTPRASKTGCQIGCHRRFSCSPLLVHHTDNHMQSMYERIADACCKDSCTAI